jgi:hypothetical protein
MPLTLGSLSRRELLGAAVAAAAGTLGRPWTAWGDQENFDPHCFALLSDTHINADKAWAHRTGIRPWDHIVQVRKEVLELSPKPAGVLVCGDCACLRGLPEDYARFMEAVQPLRDGGLPLHLALGNHDRHRNFLKAMPPTDARRNGVAGRYVGIVRSPRANWFILDSLVDSLKVAGELGDKQLAWLAKALDANADKPALVMVHHNPRPSLKSNLISLEDTRAMLAVLSPRKQVKAWIYGHTHVWGYVEREGIHFINLPATAWLFLGHQPAGWVKANLRERGAVFELVALRKEHPSHGEKLELAWR